MAVYEYVIRLKVYKLHGVENVENVETNLTFVDFGQFWRLPHGFRKSSATDALTYICKWERIYYKSDILDISLIS